MESKPSPNRLSPSDLDFIHAEVARLRAGVHGLVLSMFGGLGLFSMTAILLLRGGEDVGAHLSLLSHYLPGYTVSWPGAFLGLVYGALLGGVLGACFAWLYNVFASRRDKG